VNECSDEVFVPNAFSPDGNGLNDVLRAKAYFRIDSFELRIYNRWGQEVFLTKNIFTGWDGTFKGIISDPGQYVWKMFYKRNNKFINRKGTVLLIR
jgi:gliding motility-associated-like protein